MTLDPAIADVERRLKESGIPGLYSGSGPDIGVGVHDRAEGTVDSTLRVLDVCTNTVALAFHFVSNRPTFSAIFEQGVDPVQVQAERRAAIIDTIERQVLPRPLAPAPRGAVRARADLAARA